MDRRKLLISIGALGAGGAAAFGTEAFTSIEAERSVDVSVAGDSSAYLAFQALDSSNANNYVSTESDDTLAIDLDGDGGADGGGVNQDAITQVEDLFKIVNQGTQPTSVYFEDDSDAVTFRVTRSTNTSTNGSNGQSLEGAANSVELDVGEQVVVGLTIDTLNNDVSGSLSDSVTVYADATPSAPQQNIPQPQYVVDGTGDAPGTYAKLSEALADSDVSNGSVIGIEGGVTVTETSKVTVDQSVTITGFEGTPTVDATDFGSDGGAIDVNADGVTFRNFTLEYSGQSNAATNAIEAVSQSGLTIDGLTVDNLGSLNGSPAINAEGCNTLTITDNTVTDGNIGISHDDSVSETITVSGNYVDANSGGGDTVPEGIFLGYETGGDISNKQFEVRNNLIDNSAAGSADIKVGPSSNLPESVNEQSGKQAQLESLLTENSISRARIDDGTQSDGTLVTDSLSAFGSIQSAIDTATTNGVTLVDSGSYTESVQVTTSGLKLKGINSPTIEGEGVDVGSKPHAAIHVNDGSGPVRSVTVEGFTVRNPNGKFGIFAGTGSTNSSDDGIGGLVIRDNVVEDTSTTSSGGSLTGGPAGIGIRGDYGTSGYPGIEIDSNVVRNVQTSGYTNAVGITLKSFTGDAGFGKDSSGADVSDPSSPPATDTTISNNKISNIDGGDDSRTKGVSVSGEFEDVVVENNSITSVSAATDGSSGNALGITLSENGGSYSKNEYDIDNDGNGERIGPRDFEIKNNEFLDITAGAPVSVNIGGYEDLSGGGNQVVKNNNFLDTGAGVARFAGDQPGYQIGDGDSLDVRNNYWGASDGPSGEDGVGGSGAPAVTVGEDSNGNNRTGKVSADEPATDAAGYSKEKNEVGSSL